MNAERTYVFHRVNHPAGKNLLDNNERIVFHRVADSCEVIRTTAILRNLYIIAMIAFIGVLIILSI